MPSSQLTSFLELAIQAANSSEREAVRAAFSPTFETASDGVEFDLALWSLAARLRTDTEELLRKTGALWAQDSGVVAEFASEGSPDSALETCVARVAETGIENAPLPGLEAFQLEVLETKNGWIKLACEGPRRCCSFLEGVTRAVCDSFEVSLRYQRFPKSATSATLVFSLV